MLVIPLGYLVDWNRDSSQDSLINTGFYWAFNSDDSQSKNGRDNGSVGSDLLFGSTSGSNFRVAPGVGFNLAVNITNAASESDSAIVSLDSLSGWPIHWNDGGAEGARGIPLDAGQLDWIEFSVSVPLVVNGTPHAGSKHGFGIAAESANDGAMVYWNFTIEVEAWAGIALQEAGVNDSVWPGQKVRLPVTLRNIGNEPSGLAVRIEAATSDGTPIGDGPDQSFVWDGWQVGLFDVYHVNGLSQNETGTLQVEFAAPERASGTVHALVTAWNPGAPENKVTTLQTVTIEHIRAGNLTILAENCERPIPGSKCMAEMVLRNDGNLADVFELGIIDYPAWLVTKLDRTQVALQPAEELGGIGLTMTVLDDTPARSRGVVVVSTTMGGVEADRIEIEVTVGTFVDWTLAAVSSTSDDENVTVAFTMVNIGNDLDGILVNIDSSVTTSYGLIPTSGSVHEEGETIRSFEILDVPPDTNLTFRAWLVIPRDQGVNGTALLTVRIQSVLSPDTVFVNETMIDYLGAPWRPENRPDEGFSIAAGIESAWDAVWSNNGLLLTILVTIAGSLLLHGALKSRERRVTEWRAKQGLDEPPAETEEDWRGRFERQENKGPEPIESQEIPSDAFRTMFKARAGDASPTRMAPDGTLVNAASTVLDHGQAKLDTEAADELAAALLDDGSQHEGNLRLEPAQPEIGRTVRIERGASVGETKTDATKEGIERVGVSRQGAETTGEPKNESIALEGDGLDLDL